MKVIVLTNDAIAEGDNCIECGEIVYYYNCTFSLILEDKYNSNKKYYDSISSNTYPIEVLGNESSFDGETLYGETEFYSNDSEVACGECDCLQVLEDSYINSLNSVYFSKNDKNIPLTEYKLI